MLTTVYAFTFSSFRYDSTPFLGRSIVLIDENNMSSTEYIDLIKSSSEQLDVYPVFEETNIMGDTRREVIYYTDYPGAIPSEYPDLFSTSKIKPFEDIDKFNLNTIQVGLLGNKQNFDQFIEALQSNGLSITESNFLVESYFRSYNLEALLTLFIFNVVFMYIYVLTMKKKYAILKLEGYCAKDTNGMTVKQFKKISIVYASITVLITIALGILYELEFVVYFLKAEYLVLILYLLFIIVSMGIVNRQFKKTDIYNMKNNIVNPRQPAILMVICLANTILFINVSVELVQSFNYYKNTSKKYAEVSTIYEYSTVPVYTNISDANYSEDVNTVSKALFNFYFSTQKDLNGTLVKYNDQFENKSFDVNQNYLKKQEVLDVNGKRLTGETLPKGRSLLIPESQVDNPDNQIEVNKIIIKDGQELKYLDNYSGEIKASSDYVSIAIANYNSYSEIPKGDEETLTENITITDMMSGQYYIKTNRDDPNAVTEPYVNAAGADNYIRQTPLIGNELLRTVIFQRKKLVAYAILSITTVIMEIIILLNVNKALLLTSRKKLSIYYLNTKRKPKLLKAMIATNLIFFIAIGIAIWYVKSSTIALILSVIICGFYIINLVIMYKKIIARNLSNNIKGDV